jgi:integrase
MKSCGAVQHLSDAGPARTAGLGSIEAMPMVEALGVPICRVGDQVWDFRAVVNLPNMAQGEMIVNWPSVSVLYRDAKRALYLWSKFGRPGIRLPSPVTVIGRSEAAIYALSHFERLGFKSFTEIGSREVSDFVSTMKSQGLSSTRLQALLSIFDLAWMFREELQSPPLADPFGDQTLGQVSGTNNAYAQGFTAKTPVIPPSVLSKLFDMALSVVEDAREGSACMHLDQLLAAALFLLQIGTGMRNAEAIGVERGAWRTEVREGVTYCWVRTRVRKTGDGVAEYLAPMEVLRALEVLMSATNALHARHKAHLADAEQRFAMADQESRRDLAGNLNLARLTKNALFVSEAGGRSGKQVTIRSLTDGQCNRLLQRLARMAAVDWEIANHQCRRTFAWTVANGRLGRRSLIFLKWQLKHVTMSMTQLYAANPLQDQRLYGELYEEVVTARSDLLADWFDEATPLSGGAGRKILRMRAIAVKDKETLLRHTAEQITIRATGHSWCLGQDGACVGGGLYEATRCADCSSGVIDPSVAKTWQNIHRQNLELLAVNDCGQAVHERARREAARSEQVLRDLGVRWSDA